MPSMFSRRHYEAIAEVLERCSHGKETGRDWYEIKMRLADLFEADNPRFDRRKFEEACER